MANRQLTGAYPSGYVLETRWTGAVVQATALVEGTGFSASDLATVTNEGTVAAGAGAAGAAKVRAGTGGDGVYLAVGGLVTNLATIEAGAGGVGGYDAVGGLGGAGIEITGAGSATNKGVIGGGAGGAAGADSSIGTIGAQGGNGGAGLESDDGASLSNTGTITGGAGGLGGAGPSGGGAGHGGHGGAGLVLADGGTVSNLDGEILGGAGGATSTTGRPTDGGNGGVAITSAAGAVEVVNRATIIGGAGGVADPDGEDDGEGGDAIRLAGTGASIRNSGVIEGGTGGFGSQQGGVEHYEGGSGVEMLAAGVVSNSGSIAGGASTDRAGYGVILHAGGTVLNQGVIDGGDGESSGGDGGWSILLDGGGVVRNSGVIEGGAPGGAADDLNSFGGGGVLSGSGGYLLNTDLIEGGAGDQAVNFNDGGTIVNLGTMAVPISEPASNGVVLSGGAVLWNGSIHAQNALIEGGVDGIAYRGPSTVTNFGTIQGLAFDGVYLSSGSSLTNTGEIFGGTGRSESVGWSTPGGAGAIGASFNGLTNFANTGTISGGLGGAGVDSSIGPARVFPPGSTAHYYYEAGAGGAGGVGLALNDAGIITCAGKLFGGAGGAGAAGGQTYSAYGDPNFAAHAYALGAVGGDGGAGASVAEGETFTLDGAVVGGAGGAGGRGGHDIHDIGNLADPAPNGYGGGAGGAGGDGVGNRLGGVITIIGRATGGDGGDGGAGAAAPGGQKGSGGAGGDGGDGGAGVDITAAGTVVNLGVIVGGAGGVGGTGGAGYEGGKKGQTGTHGTAGDGVETWGGVVVNGAQADVAALISGGVGVAAGDGTVINFGTIVGLTEAVDVVGGVVDAETGSSFVGLVSGAQSGLNIEGGTGTITGLGATAIVTGSVSGSFASFDAYQIVVGSSWTLTGENDLAGGQSLVDDGQIDITGDLRSVVQDTVTIGAKAILIVKTGGSAEIDGALVNDGKLEASGATAAVSGSVGGTGQVRIGAHGEASFGAAFSQDVTFTGTTGVLALAQAQGFTGSVTGFSTGGGTSLDLEDIAFTGSTVSYTGTATSGVLTVTSGADVARIALEGDYLGSTFVLSADAGGGTIVTDPMAQPAAASITQAMAGFDSQRSVSTGVTHSVERNVPTMFARPGVMTA